MDVSYRVKCLRIPSALDHRLCFVLRKILSVRNLARWPVNRWHLILPTAARVGGAWRNICPSPGQNAQLWDRSRVTASTLLRGRNKFYSLTWHEILLRCWSLGSQIMEIPPGFICIAQIIPRLLLVPAGVFWVCNLIFSNAIPQWLQISTCLLGFPAVIYFNGIIFRYYYQRQAKLRCAILAPSVPNRWPGGIDLLVELIDSLKHGYMGLSSSF